MIKFFFHRNDYSETDGLWFGLSDSYFIYVEIYDHNINTVLDLLALTQSRPVNVTFYIQNHAGKGLMQDSAEVINLLLSGHATLAAWSELT